ncbi:hypothetical protein [Falsiroseomonas sp. CW058]|uniref:hypothetical protein n=1 Tax=Falsiroseomonas sp. CW058 TaxID=3388664 RepID=UPI003D320847
MLPEIPAPIVSALTDAPLALALLWMVVQLRRDLAARQDPPPSAPGAPPRDELAEFKLEVARTYVPLSLIRDLDSRLSLQLIRIEEKLDEVSRAATAAQAVSGHALGTRKMGFAARGDAETRA